MAMHVCRNFRPYAVKVSLAAKSSITQKSPIGARFYHSGAPTPMKGRVSNGGTVGVSFFVLWLLYRFDFRGVRTEFDAKTAKAHSNKFDYAKSEMERIQRKIDAMKEVRRESLGLDPPVGRKIDAMKKKNGESLGLDPTVCRKIDAMKEKHRESLGFDPPLNFSHRKLFATVSSPPKNFSHRKLFATVFSDISRITRDGQQQ